MKPSSSCALDARAVLQIAAQDFAHAGDQSLQWRDDAAGQSASDQQCAEQAGRADDDDSLPQRAQRRQALRRTTAASERRAAAGAAIPPARSATGIVSSSAVNGDVVRVRVLSNADRASGGGMTRPRRSFGHEDAKTRSCVRNDTSVPVEPLSRPAKRSSTASPSSRKPITSGANTGTATSWNSCPSSSAMPAAGSSDSIASRSGESSSISSPVRSFSDDATSTAPSSSVIQNRSTPMRSCQLCAAEASVAGS